MCSFPGCPRRVRSKGLCGSHYNQQLRGLPLTPLAPFRGRRRVEGTLAERLAAKSERRPDGCLVWTGTVKANGYGRLVFEGRDLHVHRVAYELAHGPIPDGLTVDHLCGTRACIEPTHLEVVTRSVNSQRGNPRPTQCVRGHELAGDNVRWRRNGTRQCRTCDRIHAARKAA